MCVVIKCKLCTIKSSLVRSYSPQKPYFLKTIVSDAVCSYAWLNNLGIWTLTKVGYMPRI